MKLPGVNVRSVQVIDVHNAGMPVRIVFVPRIPGGTVSEKKLYCEAELDWVRKILTYEPRGSSSSYGVVVTSPTTSKAHLGVVFFDSSGWHDMCGHASMALVCYLVRSGFVKIEEVGAEIVLETPAGLVRLGVELLSGELRRVRMINVPSYVLRTLKIEVGSLGLVNVYVSYGGNLYGVVDLDELGLDFSLEHLQDMWQLAKGIWRGLVRKDPEIGRELYGVRFSKRIRRSPPRYYGILFFGKQERPLLDRSPSGTGSSAHLAYLYAAGEVGLNEEVEFVSAVGTVFIGRVLREVEERGLKAVVPEISTSDRGCHLMGYATVIAEDGDPIGLGFPPLTV